MNIIGYVRVSTDDQEVVAQREEILRRYPEARIVEEFKSAKTVRLRRELTGVLAGLQRGDKLVVAKLDRLCRDTRDFLELCDRARRGGWTLEVLDLGIDTGTAYGEMIVTCLVAFATLERRMISRRTVDKLESDRPVLRTRRERVLGLRSEGWSQRAIARELGIGKEQVARVMARVR